MLALVHPAVVCVVNVHVPAIEIFTMLLDLLQLIIEAISTTDKVLIKIFIEWLKFDFPQDVGFNSKLNLPKIRNSYISLFFIFSAESP